MFYVADWLPTLRSLTKANFRIDRQIDGFDQSAMLRYNLPSPRSSIVTVDDVAGYSSFISLGFKVLNGSSSKGKYDTHLGTNENVKINIENYVESVLSSDVAKALQSPLNARNINNMRERLKVYCRKGNFNRPCDLTKGPCLYNLIEDECEENNLANLLPGVVNSMMRNLRNELRSLKPSVRRQPDARCDPRNFNLTWTYWQNDS
jgi:hypothetical protein